MKRGDVIISTDRWFGGRIKALGILPESALNISGPSGKCIAESIVDALNKSVPTGDWKTGDWKNRAEFMVYEPSIHKVSVAAGGLKKHYHRIVDAIFS